MTGQVDPGSSSEFDESEREFNDLLYDVSYERREKEESERSARDLVKAIGRIAATSPTQFPRVLFFPRPEETERLRKEQENRVRAWIGEYWVRARDLVSQVPQGQRTIEEFEPKKRELEVVHGLFVGFLCDPSSDGFERTVLRTARAYDELKLSSLGGENYFRWLVEYLQRVLSTGDDFSRFLGPPVCGDLYAPDSEETAPGPAESVECRRELVRKHAEDQLLAHDQPWIERKTLAETIGIPPTTADSWWHDSDANEANRTTHPVRYAKDFLLKRVVNWRPGA